MLDEAGTLERVAAALADALAGLSELAQPANLAVLLNELGVDRPPDLRGDAQLAQRLSDVVARATELTPRVEGLILAAEEGGAGAIVTAGSAVLAQCAAVGAALDAVGVRLQSSLATVPGGPQLAAELAQRVTGDLIARYLDAQHPLLRRVLTLATIVEWDVVTPESETAAGVVRRRLHPERLPALLSDPLQLLASGYGWGRDGFDAGRLLQRIGELFEPLDAIAAFGDEDGPPVPPVVDFGAFTLAPAATTPPGLAGTLFVDVADNAALTLAQRSDRWRVVLSLGGGFREGLTARLVPPAGLEITPPPGGAVAGRMAFEVVGRAAYPDRPIVLLGIAGASRIEATSVSAGVVATASWNAGAQRAAAEVGIRAVITGGRLFVSPAGGDGFLTAVLPRDGMRLDFDLEVGWSATRGLRFEGGTGLTVTIPVRRPMGPIRLDAVDVGGSVESGALALTTGITARLALGPAEVVIENVGLRLEADLASRGNLGVADLELRFNPPNGVGIAIDAAAVTGGGYLRFDPEGEAYAGELHLQFEGIAVRALGLLTTRLPGGAPGYSLLVLVSAEFPPLQLGLGFMLVGVGGLLGINRTVAVEALRAGLKTGALGAVLSPPDPKANAGQLVATLAGLFPPAAGRHVFAPTARIVWGTPTQITIELCLVLELPAPVRLVALGRLRAVLPDEREAVVRLQVDVLGVIDFDRREAAVDATLVDSRLAQFALTGDMALRMSWGARPSFLLAVGGFHPRFAAPPGFPALERVAVALAGGDNPKLRLEAYLALTSNTVQFGARVDLAARAGGFSVAGFLSFDALVALAPLAFVVDVAARLAVKAGGHTILSVSLALTLSGPRPWRARGRASFSILFFDVSFGFDVTIGDDAPPALPAPVDVAPLLLAALADARAWSAPLPAGAAALVTLRAPEPGTAVLAHPFATLQVRQRVAPLERTLERFGTSVPSGATRFKITLATIGGVRTTLTGLQDRFAPAQFTALSDDAKLSAPSFEEMTSGAALGADGYVTGAAVTVGVVYEQLLVTAPGVAAPPSQRVAIPGDVFATLTATPPERPPAFAVREAA